MKVKFRTLKHSKVNALFPHMEDIEHCSSDIYSINELFKNSGAWGFTLTDALLQQYC